MVRDSWESTSSAAAALLLVVVFVIAWHCPSGRNPSRRLSMALFLLGGAFLSLIVVATEEEEELAVGTSEATMPARQCVALRASRFASVITASRENSDSGEEVTSPPVVPGGAFCHHRPQRHQEGTSPTLRIFFSRSSFRWDGISWRPKPIGTSCPIYHSCPFFSTY